MKVRFAARAAAQVRGVNAWWRDHHAEVSGFIDELGHAIELVTITPDLGAIYEPNAASGVRRLLLPRSQYYVYYVHWPDRDLVRILALWSCHRGRAPQLDLPHR